MTVKENKVEARMTCLLCLLQSVLVEDASEDFVAA